MDSKTIITKAYSTYYSDVVRYISYKTGDSVVAEDMAQDVFLKILCYDAELLWESMKNLIYKITVNLVNDYWRRHYVRQEADAYLTEMMATSSNSTEESVNYRDLRTQEQQCLSKMAKKRREVYNRRRFYGESAQEIADSMGLSRRTVENHLFLGYKEMRTYISACC